jgi:hypothetical protein
MLRNAYPAEILLVVTSAIGALVNTFTLISAKLNLRAVWCELPVDGQRVLLGQKNVRRESVNLWHVQIAFLVIGLIGIFTPPPPWPWVEPVSQLTANEYRVLVGAQATRVILAWVSIRKMVLAVQNWIDERPLRKPRRRTDIANHATIAQDAATAAQGAATVAQGAATIAQTVASERQAAAADILQGSGEDGGS